MENQQDELIDKWLKGIETAGTSANAFGWVILCAYPVFSYLLGQTGHVKTIMIWFVFILPLMAFYIYSGKYIKHMVGPNVPYYLLANAISSILLIKGLIPLILSYQSFKAYAYFSKVSKTDIVVKTDENKSRINNSEIVTFIAILIVGSLIVFLKSNFGISE